MTSNSEVQPATPSAGGAIDLLELTTPALLLDRDKVKANARRLAERMDALDCVIRPHVKTHKCIELTDDILAAGHTRGITVSTMKEAAFFFAHGFTDILYAVGISPNKFADAADLIEQGCELTVILDSEAMASLLCDFAEARGVTLSVLIELDTDGHRAGINPESAELLRIGQRLNDSHGTQLRGVMTHAGASYGCNTPESLLAMARQERDRSVGAAGRLVSAGLPCPVVSVGSTPTAFSIDELAGVTEVRAGVYATFDLVMVGIGVCNLADIAMSVLVTVTGYQQEKNWLITDGGWMAMSRDRGTADQDHDYGYGAVTDLAGNPLPLVLSGANQEHGIITPSEPGGVIDFSAYPLGTQLRILPNHACATAAQYDHFDVLESGQLTARWSRSRGW